MKDLHLIYEKITFLNLSHLIIRSLFKKNKIYYIKANKYYINAISFFKIRIFKINLFEIDQLSKKDSLQYKKTIILKKLIDTLIESKFNNKKSYDLNPDYFRKIIGAFYYDKLNSQIDYILLLEEAKKNGRFNNEKVYLYVNKIPNFDFFKYLIEKETGVPLRKSFSLRFFYPFPILIIKSILIYFASLFKFKNKNLFHNLPKIFIKYQKNMFDRYPDAGPLYWFENSKLNKDEIFIYEEKKNISMSELKEIQNLGFNFINILGNKGEVVNPFSVLKRYKKFSNTDFFKDAEFNSIKFYIIWKIECYKKIFKKYNVKMLNQHQEFSADALSKYIALQTLEGVSFWGHWSSVNQLSTHYYYSFVDIILSWGKLDTDYYNIHKTNFKKIFEVGIVNGDHLNYEIKNSTNYNYSKPKIKICLFDTSHSEYTIYVNTKLILSFYKEVLKFFVDKQHVKIFIKSKGRSFEKIKKNTEIKELYETMSNNKQLEVIDPKVTPHNIAKNCDLTISFDYNTAGIISGMSGIRSIFINSSNLNNHPFHLFFKENNISFSNFKEFSKFFDINDLNKIKKFDFEIKNKIDKYQDNFANLRSAEIIARTFNLIKDKKYQNIFDNLDLYFSKKWKDKNKIVSGKEKNLWL